MTASDDKYAKIDHAEIVNGTILGGADAMSSAPFVRIFSALDANNTSDSSTSISAVAIIQSATNSSAPLNTASTARPDTTTTCTPRTADAHRTLYEARNTYCATS